MNITDEELKKIEMIHVEWLRSISRFEFGYETILHLHYKGNAFTKFFDLNVKTLKFTCCYNGREYTPDTSVVNSINELIERHKEMHNQKNSN